MSETLSTPVRTRDRLVGTESELRAAIDAELAGRDGGTVVMGGHFMLMADADSGELMPGVVSEQRSDTMRARVSGRVGVFPEYTWGLSVDIAARDADTRLLLLINDWQYVPVTDKSAGELRAEFYAGFARLPAEYEKTLRAAGMGPERVLASRKHPLAFPETWLKYRFQKAADKFVRQGLLEKRVLDSGEADTEVAFLDENGNYRTLISCGVTGCAGEITEMVAEVHKAGYRTLVVFAPGECMAPVRTGVSTALSLYRLSDMVVVVADPGGSGEGSAEEIFAKGVTVSTFRS